MPSRFVQQIERFMKLANQLQEKGLKKKDIARQLEIFPSVYSALTNNMFPSILTLESDTQGSNQQIERIFSLVNNVSEKRIRRDIEDYIFHLERLLEQEVEGKSQERCPNYVEEHIASTPKSLIDKLTGTYECFYISSFGYRVKKEPFLIRTTQKGQVFQARKGNVKSPAFYDGFLYITSNQLLTAQLLEVGTINRDNFIIHFILPPSYEKSLHFFKGIGVSMSNSYMPISRKIILKKVNDNTKMEIYNQIETTFYEKGDCGNEHTAIINYLRADNALMEYLPVPYPSFDEQDLERELSVREFVMA